MSGEMINQGDKVQQIGPSGLGILDGIQYVVNVADGELELSKSPEGPPLTDFHGQPRHFPLIKFRKVTWA